MNFTESDIKSYNSYADDVIAEIYPLIKKAVSSHAAARMKKEMLHFKENGLDERMDLAENKSFFLEMANVYCDASILAQIRFSNKAYRATLTKESILEKCQICNLDIQSTKQILKVAGFNIDG